MKKIDLKIIEKNLKIKCNFLHTKNFINSFDNKDIKKDLNMFLDYYKIVYDYKTFFNYNNSFKEYLYNINLFLLCFKSDIYNIKTSNLYKEKIITIVDNYLQYDDNSFSFTIKLNFFHDNSINNSMEFFLNPLLDFLDENTNYFDLIEFENDKTQYQILKQFFYNLYLDINYNLDLSNYNIKHYINYINQYI